MYSFISDYLLSINVSIFLLDYYQGDAGIVKLFSKEKKKWTEKNVKFSQCFIYRIYCSVSNCAEVIGVWNFFQKTITYFTIDVKKLKKKRKAF